MDTYVASISWWLYNAEMNSRLMYLFGLVFLFVSDICPGVELLGHVVVLFLHFWEISILFSTVAAPIQPSISSVQGFPFCTSWPTLVFSVLFDDSYSEVCKAISHCGFDLYFHNNQWCWASLHVPVDHVYSVLLLIFKSGCLFFWCWVVWAVYVCLYMLDIKPLLVTSFANSFSHSVGFLFILLTVSLVVQKLLSLILFIFAFSSFILGDRSKKILLWLMLKSVCLCFLPGVL